ncbi:MAG: hypothetical protein KA479_11870 [Saprospiraceae bacterium]|jgi:hypothetical protein|nr:hypothetical protein [Saprospiraceae bacterium]
MINGRILIQRAGLTGLLVFFLFSISYTQPSHDNHWIFGYGNSTTNERYGLTHIDFSNGHPEVTSLLRKFPMQPSGQVISDATGKLLLLSNGCRIINSEFNLLPHPNPAIPGILGLEFCDPYFSYPTAEGNFFLPLNDTLYYFVYKELSQTEYYTESYGYYKITINPEINFSELREITSNQVYREGMTTVKHGNGRDYWILTPGIASNQYHRALATPDGIFDMGWIKSGIPFLLKAYNGNMTFSRDGSMMARSDPFNGVHLYGFDRCQGTFTSYKRITPFKPFECEIAFCEFSPNGKFLYVAFTGYIQNEIRSILYQLNLSELEPWATRLAVGEVTGGICSFGSPVYGPFVHGPDGKLYNFVYDNCDALHIIHHPNEKGIACDVENGGLRTPSLYRLNMPIFPNSRLGRDYGSPCDTIGRNNNHHELTATPNPATGSFTASVRIPLQTSSYVHFALYDFIGRLVDQVILPIDRNMDLQSHIFQTTHLSTGTYLLRAEVPGLWSDAIKVQVY